MSINEHQIKLFGGVLADYCLFLSDSVEVPPHWETVRQTLRLAAHGVKDSCCWQSSAGISCFRPDQASGSEMRWKRTRIPMPFGGTCAHSRKMHHARVSFNFCLHQRANVHDNIYCATSKAGYAAWQESWITMVPGLKGSWVFRPISWRGHVQVISAVHPLSCFWMQQLNMPWRNNASFLLSCSGANANIDSKKHQETYTAILNSPNFFLTLVTLVMEIPPL